MNPGSQHHTADNIAQEVTPLVIAIVLIVSLAMRLLHLASAVDNPFTYHLGPDEDYYLRFGRWVAGIANGNPAEFAFMDPVYGYLLGFFFKLLGPNQFAVMVLQVLLDTVTAMCIFFIGRELGRPRAGFYGAFFYALTATAVLYSVTFLKATWVANAIVLWVFAALLVLRSPRPWAWLLFGLFCGYCIGLRSNLLLLAAAALILLPWLRLKQPGGREGLKHRMLLLGIGILVPLLVLSARNQALSGKFTPLPNNGGTVLHQVYNADNPRAESWYPPFAPYSHPSEILRGYAMEAERRTGRSMSPAEVDAYWRREALDHIFAHPGEVARNMGRKAIEFTAVTEVANNRSLVEERLFSPILRWLPSPFVFLLALGVPGLYLLVRWEPRAALAVVPVLVVLATFMVFFAEARFRFHAVPLMALGAGFFVDDAWSWIRQRHFGNLLAGLLPALLLASLSLWAARQVPTPTISWDSVVWGYIKMGDLPAAEETLNDVPAMDGTSAKWEEARGFIAWSRQDHERAAEHYRKAVELNPGSHVAHYNLAMMLAATGDREQAIHHVDTAIQIADLPEYRQLLNSLIAK